MKTRAAVLTGYHQPFQVMELELDEPGPHEVLLKMSAAGLCHSDLHMMDGDTASGSRSSAATRRPGSSSRSVPG